MVEPEGGRLGEYKELEVVETAVRIVAEVAEMEKAFPEVAWLVD